MVAPRYIHGRRCPAPDADLRFLRACAICNCIRCRANPTHSAAGREPLPPWPVLPLTHSNLLSNFTFTIENLKRANPKWWTLLTSAFCHSDAAHRDRNLVNLLLCGLQLAPELGRLGLAVTFLGGHAAAALNARGLRLQLERFLDARTGSSRQRGSAARQLSSGQRQRRRPCLAVRRVSLRCSASTAA